MKRGVWRAGICSLGFDTGGKMFFCFVMLSEDVDVDG